MDSGIAILVGTGIVTAGVVAFSAIAGWIHLTRMKIRNGYPLENMWGKPLHPQTSSEAQERIALLTQENAALRAEFSAQRERLETVERIVTDSGYHLSSQIEGLRITKETN